MGQDFVSRRRHERDAGAHHWGDLLDDRGQERAAEGAAVRHRVRTAAGRAARMVAAVVTADTSIRRCRMASARRERRPRRSRSRAAAASRRSSRCRRPRSASASRSSARSSTTSRPPAARSAVESVELRARVVGLSRRRSTSRTATRSRPATCCSRSTPPLRGRGAAGRGRARALAKRSRRKAEADVARNQRLLPPAPRASGSSSSIASKDTADAEITSARGSLEKAKLNLEFSRVTAPVNGRVSKANVTVGNLVAAARAPRCSPPS